MNTIKDLQVERLASAIQVTNKCSFKREAEGYLITEESNAIRELERPVKMEYCWR